MVPDSFQCSDMLRDLIQRTVEKTDAYRKAPHTRVLFGVSSLKLHDHFKHTTKVDCPIYQQKEWAERIDRDYDEVSEALKKVLWQSRDSLPTALQEEIEDLNQRMLGVMTGYGCPVVSITNLPEGTAGLLAAAALTKIASHTDKLKSAVIYGRVDTPGQIKNSRLHMDGSSMLGLAGGQTGNMAIVTTFVSADEFIDEVTRLYNAATDSPHSRDDIAQRLCHTMIMFDPLRAEQKGKDRPVLTKEVNATPGQPWPGEYRFGPNFFAHHFTYCEKTDPDQLKLQEAITKARLTLNRDNGVVITPGNLVLLNDKLIIHGRGSVLENHPAAKRGTERVMMQHKAVRNEDDGGFGILADPIELRDGRLQKVQAER